MPRVTSAERQLTIAASEAGKKSARSLRPEIKYNGNMLISMQGQLESKTEKKKDWLFTAVQ